MRSAPTNGRYARSSSARCGRARNRYAAARGVQACRLALMLAESQQLPACILRLAYKYRQARWTFLHLRCPSRQVAPRQIMVTQLVTQVTWGRPRRIRQPSCSIPAPI